MNDIKGTIRAIGGEIMEKKKQDIRNALNIRNPNLGWSKVDQAVDRLSKVPTTTREAFIMINFATSLKGKDAMWEECCWRCGTPVGHETFEAFEIWMEKRLKNDNYCPHCKKYRSRKLNRVRAWIKGNPQF